MAQEVQVWAEAQQDEWPLQHFSDDLFRSVDHTLFTSPFIDPQNTSDAPKGIEASYAPVTDGQAYPPSAVSFQFAPVAVASTGSHYSRRKKAKKGQAKDPFRPSWYSARKIYSDKTLYNKVGIPQMEAFLIGEGVDIAEKFPKGRCYIQQDSKRVKINRGDALKHMVKMVHQRVIDRRNAGHAVEPNQAPHLGAEDWEAQIAAFDSGNSPGTAIGNNSNVPDADTREEDPLRANGHNQALVFWESGESAQVNGAGHAPGTVFSDFSPEIVVPPAPHYIKRPLPTQTKNVASQQHNQTLQDLRFFDNGIMSQLEHGSKALESGEQEIATFLELDNDKISELAQAKTAEIERLVGVIHGRVVISAEAQALVRHIIDLGIRYINIDSRLKGNTKFSKERYDANDDFQRARSDLMQMIANDVVWDHFVPHSGRRVAEKVVEVLPWDPLKVLN
ncbi:hypothetical protein SLS60_010832 [Paraconiothyrium brasiliense]|uniref:Uncharacterized protein n=1 Tax=Paraconiothyrium brasiliense TaxID=300254 RepID=A0ABR3QM42_9PLEO